MGGGNNFNNNNNFGYGPPNVMGGPHHGSHHGGHMGGHGGRMGGGGGAVPFRAGDWKCGNEVCGYHNFAKNVCCLRCGASRAGAAVVADSGYPSPMDSGSQYGMGQGSMAGTPGPGPFNSGSNFGSGGYNQHFSGPPGHFLPSGLTGGAGAYPGSMNPQGFNSAPGSHGAGPFDSRAAEAAFQSATNGPVSGGPGNNSSNFYNSNANSGNGNENDPFAFLSSGISGLAVTGNEPRQNGSGAPSSKSPA
ncbi:hypothetical protein Golomagni_06930 [Golovinomyces magnicellulatus]|nr:hypothetical protein Golomagni_06930 [Golovinomyces magnicellulatus]